MRVLYSRSHSLGSLLIRLVTWSRWSHCAIVTDAATVIESRALLGGVVEREMSTAIADATTLKFVEVQTADDAAGIAWARQQVGKPYDWSGVIGIALHRVWDEPDRWFCSELVEAALAAAGRRRFRVELGRVTPQHSWMVAP